MSACGDCKFWRVSDWRTDGSGPCRRLPPTVLPVRDGGGVYAEWPHTKPTDWCGEHRTKQALSPEDER
jgi:hypothetical protein